MTYTLQQFGKQVKQKFPHLRGSDAEVARQVIQQYPEYRSWVSDATLGADAPAQYLDPGTGRPVDGGPGFLDSQDVRSSRDDGGSSGFRESVAQPQKQKSFGSKVLGFLGQTTGVSGLYNAYKKGKAVDVAANQMGVNVRDETNRLIAEAKKFPLGSPQRKALLAQAQQMLGGAGAGADALLASVPKDRQVIGSAGKMALTAASFGLGSAATVGGRVVAGTALGGGLGAADAAERGGSAGDIAKGAGIGAATGLVASGLFEGVRWAAQNLPKRLWGGVSGFTNTEMRDAKTQRALEYALKNKRIGTNASLQKTSEKAVKVIGEKIDDMLAKAGDGAVGSIDDVLDDIVAKYPNAGLDREGLRSVFANAVKEQRMLIAAPLEHHAQNLNYIRKSVGEVLGDRGFRNTAEKFDKELLKDFYFGLSDKVESLVPGTKDLLRQQSAEITLLDGLRSMATKSGNNKILTLGDLVLGGGGFAGAGPVGAAGAVALNKVLHSTLANTLAANMVGPVSNILVKLAPAEQQLIVQAIANATQNQPQP